MPMYQYRCTKCDHVFEKLVRMSAVLHKQDCPKCETVAEKQVTAPVGFDLRGEGWYSKGNA